MTLDVAIFIFVNPTSGGNAASALLTSGNGVQIPLKGGYAISIFDIRDGPSGEKAGFLKLQSHIAATTTLSPGEGLVVPNPARVIAAGGDGTVMWVFSELVAHKIDLRQIALGVLPFGTGNDFARTLDWELPSPLKPFDDHQAQLKELVREWQLGVPVLHDIWNITIEVYPDGRFLQVDPEDRLKKEILDRHTGSHLTRMELQMSNYFSLGVESRIGIGFNKNRTKSAFRNKVKYTSEGIKKALVTPGTISIQEAIHSMTTQEDLSIFGGSSIVQPEEGNNEAVVFTTAPSPHPLLKRAVSFIALNIPSFASGLDLWKTAEGSCGFVGDQFPTGVRPLGIQKMGDGMLEFVIFQSTAALGAEMTTPGRSLRVHQGQGPFNLEFNPLDFQNKVYFQIDGEFFVMRYPKRVQISWRDCVPVLANRGCPRLGTNLQKVLL